MAKETKKVGLQEINFSPLGVGPGSDDEVVIDETQEQPKEEEELSEVEEQEIESEEEEEIQEDDASASEESEEDDKPVEEPEDEEEEDEASDKPLDEDEGEEFNVFQNQAEELGIDLEGEDFKDINFDDPTEQDLSKFIDVMSTKLSERKLNSVFEEIPEAEGFIEFARNGGDPRQYIETMYPQFDYNEVDFEEQVAENEEAQEQLVRNHYAAEGMDQEEIDEMVEDFRAGGILNKQAKRSLGKLQTMQKQAQEKLVKEQEKAAKQREEAAQEERQEIETLIEESESIKGLKIPKTDKDDLKSYLFEQVDEQGRSQAYKDGMNMTHEERVAIAYLKMKNFDFTTLIEKEAETKNAKRLKEQIKQSKEKKTTGKKRQKQSSGKIQDIKPLF